MQNQTEKRIVNELVNQGESFATSAELGTHEVLSFTKNSLLKIASMINTSENHVSWFEIVREKNGVHFEIRDENYNLIKEQRNE